MTKKSYAIISKSTGKALITHATRSEVERFIDHKSYVVIDEYTGEVQEKKKTTINWALVVVNVLTVLLLAWLLLSSIDVITTNTNPEAMLAQWNAYTLITNSAD